MALNLEPNKDAEDLLLQIGEQLNRLEPAAKKPGRQQLVVRAKAWLNVRLTVFQQTICGSPRVRELCRSGDTVALTGAIAVLIGAHCPGVSEATVATLLVKLGISTICANHWQAAGR